jgi:hypothetical protein
MAAKAAARREAARQRVEGLVQAAENFRSASQGTTFAVKFGTPGARSETTEGWIDYKSHGYRKGITSHDITITVHENYEARVHARDLTNPDGLLTLDAEPIEAPDGFEVYRAVWARQGRGLAIDVERGVIARHIASRTTFHSTADDPKKAVTGLRRKLTAQGLDPAEAQARRTARQQARAAKQAISLARLVQRVAAWDLDEIAHVPVTYYDSQKAGNCREGTLDFAERLFPDRDPMTDTATIGEIAAKVGRMDLVRLTAKELEYARQIAAACLVAIRKDRQARRLVMA